MLSIDFNPSTRILFGENALSELGDAVRSLHINRVLLVTDPGIIAAGHVDVAASSLAAAGIDMHIFSGVVENPTTEHVADGVHFARTIPAPEMIIGMGGGSAMDCAKGINFLFTNGGRMEDYWGIGKATRPMLPSIGVPTTAGTGSEAQCFALISQADTHIKMACGDRKARFHTVILDPVLLTSVPFEVAAVTGMDAISHALESFVCTRKNAISQMYAREAWRLLESNFEKALQEPENMNVQSKMLIGAHFSGMAIENSMLGAAHAAANPLTAEYSITHGTAVSLMLPHVIRYNGEVVADQYGDLVHVTAKATKHAEVNAVEELINRVVELRSAARLPACLQETGIRVEDLDALAENAAKQWTAQFNPRGIGQAEIHQLYLAAFKRPQEGHSL